MQHCHHICTHKYTYTCMAIWKDRCPHCISLVKEDKELPTFRPAFTSPWAAASLELRKIYSWPKGLVSRVPVGLSHFCICSLLHSRLRHRESQGLVHQSSSCKSHLRTAHGLLSAAGCRPVESNGLIWVPGWEAKALWIEEWERVPSQLGVCMKNKLVCENHRE